MSTRAFVADLAITSLETITAFDIADGSYLFTLDELQNATIQNSQETTDITGKQGRKLASLKRNKTVTVSGSNGLVSGGLLEMQTGGDFTSGEVEVMWTDYGTVDSSHTGATSWKAIGTTGAEIEALYLKDENGVISTKLEQDTTASSGKFTYAPATKTITFHTDVTAGTEYVVFYTRKITASRLENKSDSYSKKCALYIDALAEDKCANVYRVQFYVPKADFSGEFSFEMGDNQSVHDFEAEGLAGVCGTGGSLWTYTVFGVNTADAN